MKIIKLTKGYETKIDDEDYEKLSERKWQVGFYSNGTPYARARFCKDGKQYEKSLSRYLMGLEKGDKREVDHINGDTLDNQKGNLRICPHKKNSRNRNKSKSKKSSQYKGVFQKKSIVPSCNR